MTTVPTPSDPSIDALEQRLEVLLSAPPWDARAMSVRLVRDMLKLLRAQDARIAALEDQK